MSKKLNLISEFDTIYKNSDLQKVLKNKVLPFKYTINKVDCYFYNADLYGLFEWKIKKDGLTTNDFIDDYRKGFESGLLHLKDIEKIKLKHLKNVDLREHTISQIKSILHEKEFKFGIKGLLDLVFKQVPFIFTEKTIFDYGYWNAIIFSIDDIIEKSGIKKIELIQQTIENTESKKNEKSKSIDLEYNHKVFISSRAENIFLEYSKNYILDPYTDYSFIFQQMKKDRLIHSTTHLDFAEWLNDSGFIKNKDLDKIILNKGFKSLNKSTSDKRLNNYHIISNKFN